MGLICGPGWNPLTLCTLFVGQGGALSPCADTSLFWLYYCQRAVTADFGAVVLVWWSHTRFDCPCGDLYSLCMVCKRVGFEITYLDTYNHNTYLLRVKTYMQLLIRKQKHSLTETVTRSVCQDLWNTCVL